MSEEQPKLSQVQMAALLGRPLSTLESDNYELYLSVAVERLNDLLCIKLADMADIPADLKLLIARCFQVITLEQDSVINHGVSSKKVEDFSISYFEHESNPMVDFVRLNGAVIEKYSQCQAPMRSGKVICDDCFRCL